MWGFVNLLFDCFWTPYSSLYDYGVWSVGKVGYLSAWCLILLLAHMGERIERTATRSTIIW